MTTLDALQSVQFLVDKTGKPAAVQMSVETWQALLDWIEELEDRSTIRELLPKLRKGPQKTGALKWSDARKEWTRPKSKHGNAIQRSR